MGDVQVANGVKVGASWFPKAFPFYPFLAPARFCGKALIEEKCKTISDTLLG